MSELRPLGTISMRIKLQASETLPSNVECYIYDYVKTTVAAIIYLPN